MVDVLISLIVVIILQCIFISNSIAHLRYIQFLFVNYTSIKLEKILTSICDNKSNFGKLEIEGNFYSLIKGIYKKPMS